MEAIIGKFENLGEISTLDRRLSLFIRKEANLPKVLILLKVSNVCLRLLMQNCDETLDYEVHCTPCVTFNDDVIINSESLLLELLSDITQEIDFKILKHLDIL